MLFAGELAEVFCTLRAAFDLVTEIGDHKNEFKVE